MSAHVRTAFRVVAVSLVALAAVFLFLLYLDARASGDWNYRANLWMSLGVAGFGLLGWFFPRAVGWSTLPITLLWLLWALAWGGPWFAVLVVGGVPLAVSLLFVLSGRPRRTTKPVEQNAEAGV
jgi:hypothetical protein